MFLLVLSALLTGVLSIDLECEQVLADEREYRCPAGNGTVTFAGQNDYVKLICEGKGINCNDLPRIDIANSLSLKSIDVISCPPSLLQCVYEAVNTTSVERIFLMKMTAPLLEENVKNLHGVTSLRIMEGDIQKSVPIAAINSLRSINELVIGGGVFQLSTNMFLQAPPLTYLEFNNNHMTGIPKDTFEGLSSLKKLNIWANNIANISIGAFNGLENLEMLTINNNLEYIEPGTFDSIPKLNTLVMNVNAMKLLPNGLFNGLQELNSIKIIMNRADLELDTQVLSNLPKLTKIILNDNKISKLPSTLFQNTTNIESLELSRNKIVSLSPSLFRNMVKLKYLDLGFNKIEGFADDNSPFIGLQKLEYLNLSNNHIVKLSGGLFTRQRHLKELHIDYNNITTIDWTSLHGAPNLEILTLSSNHMTLDTSTEYSQFQYLTKLKKLNLSDNKITFIYNDWRTVLTNLAYLDLRRNNFTELDQVEMDFISSSITVDLRDNQISRINFHILPEEYEANIHTSNLLLDNNPIECDCGIYGLALRRNLSFTPARELKINLNNLRCSSPLNLKGEFVKDLSLYSLVCEVETYCPDNCTCQARTATSEFSIDCLKLPTILPNLKNIDYYFIKMPTLTVKLEQQPENIAKYDIHTLNLSYANLETIDFSPTDTLKVLDLSHNRLTKVPLEFMESNITLYLAGNLFECECWQTDSISILKKYNFIADLNKITCSDGEPISNIDVTALCNNIKAATTAIIIFAILIVAFIISIIFIRRYYNEIILCLATKCCSDCIQILKPDPERNYDVFISFAHQDFEFVDDVLLPKIEKDFNYKACVHYRDWIIGDMIPTQIMRSVENSRKTIIVMSKSFIESDWANLEFGAAHNRALKEQKARVILIIMDENLTKHEGLSPELKAYINTNTYLLWNDPKFWSRLRDAMPKIEHKFQFFNLSRDRSNMGVPDALKNSGNTKPVKNGLNTQLNSQGQLINATENSDKENKSEYV